MLAVYVSSATLLIFIREHWGQYGDNGHLYVQDEENVKYNVSDLLLRRQ